MTMFTIKTPEMQELVSRRVMETPLPCTVEIIKGGIRSAAQERTVRMWCRELEEQDPNHQTAEQFRGFCKLWFGVAIMKYQSEAWAQQYDRIVAPLDYNLKLSMMMEPISYPLHRLLSTKNFKRYMDSIYLYFTGRYLDEEAKLDEMSLQHLQYAGRKRARYNPGTFVLTMPESDA